MLVSAKPHLRATVGTPNPRPLDRDTPAAQRHLARLMPVTHRAALQVVLAPRADDLDHLFFQQLGQHTQADTDAQREQPLPGRTDQLAERLLHTHRQHDLIHARLREQYVPIHGGSSLSIFPDQPATLPSGADGLGGTADLRSSTSDGTTSSYVERQSYPRSQITGQKRR